MEASRCPSRGPRDATGEEQTTVLKPLVPHRVLHLLPIPPGYGRSKIGRYSVLTTGVSVEDGVGVAVGLTVGVQVGVCVAVGVAVGVAVCVLVGVDVGLAVGELVAVAVGVAVEVGVCVGLGVGLGVGVGAPQTPKSAGM